MGSTRRIIGKIKHKWTPERPLSLSEHQQIIGWRSGKTDQRPHFIRSVQPEERLARLTTRSARFGKRIRLQQVGSVPQTAFERQELRQIQEEIQKQWGLEFGSKKIISLLAKARVLRASVALREVLGGRNPMVYQILALTALRHGLDSAEFRQQTLSMMALWRRHRSKVFWDGTPLAIYDSLRLKLATGKSLLTNIEQALFGVQHAVDARALAQKVGLDWNKRNRDLLNSCLQLLETAGLIKKMPLASFDTPVSVWFHRAHKNPPLDYPNTSFYLLQQLREGSKQSGVLYKQIKNSRGKISGTPSARFSHMPVYAALAHLEVAGLIRATSIKGRRDGKWGGATKTTQISITPLGRQLLTEHEITHSLPEWGRKLLLGEKETATSDEE